MAQHSIVSILTCMSLLSSIGGRIHPHWAIIKLKLCYLTLGLVLWQGATSFWLLIRRGIFNAWLPGYWPHCAVKCQSGWAQDLLKAGANWLWCHHSQLGLTLRDRSEEGPPPLPPSLPEGHWVQSCSSRVVRAQDFSTAMVMVTPLYTLCPHI